MGIIWSLAFSGVRICRRSDSSDFEREKDRSTPTLTRGANLSDEVSLTYVVKSSKMLSELLPFSIKVFLYAVHDFLAKSARQNFAICRCREDVLAEFLHKGIHPI